MRILDAMEDVGRQPPRVEYFQVAVQATIRPTGDALDDADRIARLRPGAASRA